MAWGVVWGRIVAIFSNLGKRANEERYIGLGLLEK